MSSMYLFFVQMQVFVAFVFVRSQELLLHLEVMSWSNEITRELKRGN